MGPRLILHIGGAGVQSPGDAGSGVNLPDEDGCDPCPGWLRKLS